jgi:DNA-binding NtrC family response regulator
MIRATSIAKAGRCRVFVDISSSAAPKVTSLSVASRSPGVEVKDHLSILAVDDDAPALKYLSLTLKQAGFDIRSADNGIAALLAMELETPALVISDLRMPSMDGLELLRHTMQRWPSIPFIMLTVSQDVETIVEAIRIGASNYILKPASPAAILNAVSKALANPGPVLVRQETFPEIIGASRAIMEVRHLLALACRSDVNVLVTGGTGTGKELVARAIHRCSRLSGGPLIAHNCAATPPDLFESQFFGHRRGAFTGADQDQPGLFERAHGGVLFLDELESLSLAHQAKLLRVLDDGEVRPVGSTEVRQVTVRLVAATNREPAAMIAERSLREDLYYRLRGFEIRLPLLSQRPEDIVLLAEYFRKGSNQALSPEALEKLNRYSWPGNVRQLRNVIHSALAIAEGGCIRAHHLIFEPGSPADIRSDPGHVSSIAGRSLRELERQAIIQALLDTSGNKSQAARVLGIDFSTLRRKMAEFGIKNSA